MRITVCYPDSKSGAQPPNLPYVTWRPFPARRRGTSWEKWRSFFSLYPESAWLATTHAQRRWVVENALSFDVVIFEQAHMAPFRRSASRIPRKILDAQNVEHALLRQLSEHLSGPRSRIRYRLDSFKMRYAESRLARTSDLIVACSKRDADGMRSLAPKTPVTVRPNGVDEHEFGYADPTDDRLETVVMTGTLGYLPNLDAAQWLQKEIWPYVRRQLPDAQLRLVGAQCPPSLAELHSPSTGFHVVGFVDDIVPELHSARVFLMPLRMGSGTRLKALQAMAAGCPIVSTSKGVEGIDVDSHSVRLAPDAAGLAQATVDLLRDEGARISQSRSARAVIESGYAWPGIVAALRDDILGDACGEVR